GRDRRGAEAAGPVAAIRFHHLLVWVEPAGIPGRSAPKPSAVHVFSGAAARRGGPPRGGLLPRAGTDAEPLRLRGHSPHCLPSRPPRFRRDSSLFEQPAKELAVAEIPAP